VGWLQGAVISLVASGEPGSKSSSSTVRDFASHRILACWRTPALLLSLGSRLLAARGTTTASVSGTVTDDSGRGIESAQVQVINRITGVVTTSATRDAGRYLVQGLEVGGPYAVVIRRIGFATQTRENVFLSLGQDLRLDVRLEPEAAVLTPVVVAGNADPAFSTSHIGVATIVSDSALRRLPTPNRDLYGFVALAPQEVACAVSPARGRRHDWPPTPVARLRQTRRRRRFSYDGQRRARRPSARRIAASAPPCERPLTAISDHIGSSCAFATAEVSRRC
jgi:hypothetical protein